MYTSTNSWLKLEAVIKMYVRNERYVFKTYFWLAWRFSTRINWSHSCKHNSIRLWLHAYMGKCLLTYWYSVVCTLCMHIYNHKVRKLYQYLTIHRNIYEKVWYLLSKCIGKWYSSQRASINWKKNITK